LLVKSLSWLRRITTEPAATFVQDQTSAQLLAGLSSKGLRGHDPSREAHALDRELAVTESPLHLDGRA